MISSWPNHTKYLHSLIQPSRFLAIKKHITRLHIAQRHQFITTEQRRELFESWESANV